METQIITQVVKINSTNWGPFIMMLTCIFLWCGRKAYYLLKNKNKKVKVRKQKIRKQKIKMDNKDEGDWFFN